VSNALNLDLYRHEQALDRWSEDCKRRMGIRFPKIDFASNNWPIGSLHNTRKRDWNFTEPLADFAGRDESFADALRCLTAEMVLAGKPKTLELPIGGFRFLAATNAESVFNLTVTDLMELEESLVSRGKLHPGRAGKIATSLSHLEKHIRQFSEKGVLPQLGFRVQHATKRQLGTARSKRLLQRREAGGTLLDAKISAFNDALEALYSNDPRLDDHDAVAIAAVALHLCAPSRINEVLCMSVDDHVTVDDYAKRPEDRESDQLHTAHQMLLLTMKGSKGAQWGAKPALNFLIDLFHYAHRTIIRCSTRSRMLVTWYQTCPDRLYLPEELEGLRGKSLTALEVAMIVYLTKTVDEHHVGKLQPVTAKLRSSAFRAPNPITHCKDGTLNPQKTVWMNSWVDVERVLLADVHSAMTACRRTTADNHYRGDLSKMLFLCDRVETPFKPWAVSYAFLRRRLRQSERDLQRSFPPTVFKKLGITMPVNGEEQIAEINTHDPRGWLTTQALRHGEKLSDVVINKWANRRSISQLKAYDYRSAEEVATAGSMPEPLELKDISQGIARASALEEQFGLRTDIVAVHDAGISVTSMNRVMEAVDDRPIARTSDQIIILYPSQFGVCLHQHHETPCTRYDSCLPCDENIAVKGHFPTNETIRKRADQLRLSVIRQLDRLSVAHNRGIADYPESLGDHMLALVKKGLGVAELADSLIEEFHEIKALIEDKLLRKRLEEAFAARGFVKRLNDQEVPSGALIKYHNPTCHASPGFERALESHGGRQEIERRELELVQRHPQFAPQSVGLTDERHRLASNDDDES